MSPRIYQKILKDSFDKWQEIHCMKIRHDDIEFLFLNFFRYYKHIMRKCLKTVQKALKAKEKSHHDRFNDSFSSFLITLFHRYFFGCVFHYSNRWN